jgi:hypothetical protein
VNERIEHCLYQAGLTAQGCWDELDDYARQGIEKFAELIVKECQQVSLKNSHRDDDMGAIIARQIKEYFGVEE